MTWLEDLLAGQEVLRPRKEILVEVGAGGASRHRGLPTPCPAGKHFRAGVVLRTPRHAITLSTRRNRLPQPDGSPRGSTARPHSGPLVS